LFAIAYYFVTHPLISVPLTILLGFLQLAIFPSAPLCGGRDSVEQVQQCLLQHGTNTPRGESKAYTCTRCKYSMNKLWQLLSPF